MNRPTAVLCMIAGLLGAGAPLQAQDAAKPQAPWRAASEPKASPAVQAAENARTPGELAPEKRPVPQISVPLKRKATTDNAAAAAAAASRPGVDDDTARCLAQKSGRERALCEQSKERKPQAAKSG